jgi:glutathione S-transferase
MAVLKLVLANKAYSSWSLRPWMLLTHFQIPFEEVVIPLDLPATRERLLAYSPTAKAPVLIDGGIAIWESLAILEYVAETFPDLPIWPRDIAARAQARALASEMHAGFVPLRQHCPTQFLRPVRKRALTRAAEADVARLEDAWRGARTKYGGAGPFLFGAFSAADAMFSPVVNRFHIYEIPVAEDTRDYMGAIMALPAWSAWISGAAKEPWRIAEYEAV